MSGERVGGRTRHVPRHRPHAPRSDLSVGALPATPAQPIRFLRAPASASPAADGDRTGADVVYLERVGADRAGPAAGQPAPARWSGTMISVGLVGLAGALLADPTGPAPRLCGAWLVPTLAWAGGRLAIRRAGSEGGQRGGAHRARRARRPVRLPPWLRWLARSRPAADTATGTHGVGAPAPAGHALAGAVACGSTAAGLALALNWRTAPLLAVGLLVGLVCRAVPHPGPVGGLARGGLTAVTFLFGCMAVRSYPAPGLLAGAAVFLLHDTAVDLVGGLGDRDGHRRRGRHTHPASNGVAGRLIAVGVLCVGWPALALAVPLQPRVAGVHPLAFRAMLGLAAALTVGTVVVLVTSVVRRARRPAPETHAVLTAERLGLACAFVALAAGLPVALALLLPACTLHGLFTVSGPGRRRAATAHRSAARAGAGR